MSKRRIKWVIGIWLVAAAAATAWVSAQTGGEVTLGNAFLVGALIATLLAAGVANFGRK